MERLWYLWLFFLCNGMVLATDSCARTVQANVDEEGDDVMLLAMPQRPRPTRKQRSRDADGDATSLFQVDEVSMPSAIVRVDSDETLMSHSWILVFVSVFLFVLLGMCALQNSKEDGNRELQTLVSRLSVKSAEELLNQFAPKESPKDPSMQKLGITRIQGRVVAKNAQTMATPFSDQQCVMYSASASQKRQDGVHQPPLAYHAACSDFAIELEGPTPLQISVHGHDVSLFQMSQGRFCKEASFSEVPEPWRGFALAHLIHGVDASCNAMSCVDLGAQGALEFCESALLHGSRVTCVGEVVRDRNGELSLCPWRPLVEGVEAPVEKRRLFPLQFSATSWETSTSSQLAGQVLISDNSQFFETFALWRWMGGPTPAASLLNA
mmetsp:Transcript_78488/g.123793  ORF Transcript_78488/g.123793 Transcript_78488/m.123793 type:complete len:381 (-) Transcript_78488:56-1198(-)